MLREIQNVRQNAGEDLRRWFTDEYWDLYIWQNGSKITGVQLSYNKPFAENAFTWIPGRRFDNLRVEGERDEESLRNSAPILTKKKNLNKEKLLARFMADSKQLEPHIVAFIKNIIEKF